MKMTSFKKKVSPKNEDDHDNLTKNKDYIRQKMKTILPKKVPLTSSL